MEVIMRNFPLDLSDDGLKRELLPFMNALGILDWTCEKTRKRSYAWATFLHESDGHKFLNQHGKVRRHPQQLEDQPPTPSYMPRPRVKGGDRARLLILQSPIYAEISTRRVDKHTLSHLKHDRERKEKVKQRDPEDSYFMFSIEGMACGVNLIDDSEGTVCFAEQSVWRGERGLHANGRFGSNSFTVSVTGMDGSGAYPADRMIIPYDTIQDLIAGQSDKHIVLILTEAPRIYSMRSMRHNRNHVEWDRTTGLLGWPSHDQLIGSALVYRIRTIDVNFREMIHKLKSRNNLSVSRHDFDVHGIFAVNENYRMRQLLGLEMLEARASRSSEALPFALVFQVQALVWNNYLRPWDGIQMLEILDRVAKDSKKNNVSMPVTAEAMKQLYQRIPYPCPGIDPAELDVNELIAEVIKTEMYLREEDFERDVYGPKLPGSQTWVFKAMVTPTRILLHGPDPESKNRVLRMFPEHNSYFLRVTFCDENGQDLALNPKISNEGVFDRYRNILKEGIKVGDRNFSFLGFSHSSLRSHSVWFMAPFEDKNLQTQTYDTILRSLGDFTDIRIPAKCAARIGQAFSETPYAVPLPTCGIQYHFIPDVKSADRSRVFSDGCGTVSWDALLEIWTYLPRSSNGPTCLQIRWGGFKGMLSVDSELVGRVLCARPESMMKFPSNDLRELGICDTSSKPLRLYLNRQSIKIMEDMGTDDGWFSKQQEKALRILRGVTAQAINTSTFLEYQHIGVNMGLPKLIKQLDRLGIDYRRDEFLKSVVEHVVLRELRLLKYKARIPIDRGVTLFGIMDETGFLNEGQIYVTYDKTHGRSSQIDGSTFTDGPVLITRSPALHPGDVQLVQMVTPPKDHRLRDLKNCVVFSQKGSRDLPSQLSGGDLDGDLYNVIWDPEALPRTSFAPANYPRVKPDQLDRPVTRSDIADFFINFMKTDVLGMIASRHVILADYRDNGTLDEDCVALAELHSTAVDFSKTGIPVNVRSMPKAPRIRPDFMAPAPPLQVYDRGQIDHIAEDDESGDDDDGMGRTKPKYYLSEKVLGKLYRNIDEKKIWAEDIHLQINMDGPSVWDQLLGLVEAQMKERDVYIDYTRKMDVAWKIRNLYEQSLSDNMWQFSDNPRSCLSEVEAFCGFILNKRGSQTRRQRDSSVKLKEEIERVMTWIIKLIRDRGAGKQADTATETEEAPVKSSRWREHVIELCWACVVVGCVDAGDASPLYHGTGKLESFRVVAACCLLKEWNSLSNKLEQAARGGGYLGVGGGKRSQITVPIW